MNTRAGFLLFAAAAAMLMSSPGFAQPAAVSAEHVTVVVEVALSASTTPGDALVAVNDMRAMIKKQPGYLSEEFLQSLNAADVPRYVHLSRWASMGDWTAMLHTLEFIRLSARGSAHFSLSAAAFQPAE